MNVAVIPLKPTLGPVGKISIRNRPATSKLELRPLLFATDLHRCCDSPSGSLSVNAGLNNMSFGVFLLLRNISGDLNFIIDLKSNKNIFKLPTLNSSVV